ncbi:family 16 glycosylhydrolase [Sinorhizobium alkalisoli]|uniref:family 16 glycosylhydrolase n=1 Tax=Sinorhizobium alkalisoli TaxID=1752398 RepID=UPI00124CC5B5|nr:family 16 glycosylhydrolase [Sinorhizobium alkalisoli]QFI69820.1 endo-1,3-1,4-beta-glycanase, C-terminal secretion signal protein [Sinorhizobium alkalisoli]
MSRFVLNAVGKPLYYSGSSTAWFSATGSGPMLYGTAGNDSMWGDSSVNVTMIGGKGDDIYYLYSSINRAYEAPGEGVDTISTWMSYTLPENFENLTVTGDNRFAFGNDLDNIIKGGSSRQTIDGGAGDDVLIGGGGADTFVVARGNGSDLITDFNFDDIVRLDGYGFTSFQQVLANVAQEGMDLRLNLADGESLVFRNTTADQLQANQFRLSLDRSVLTQTFSDDFDTLQLHDGTSGVWDPKFWWAPDKGATLTGNGELQWYINPSYQPTASANPFSVKDGVLTITAKPASEAIQTEIEGYDYTSGMLTTHSSFAQTYGYFEIRADMPDDQGVWPAFWLLPADGSWPPELDIVEMRGQDPNTIIGTVHSNETGSQTSVASAVKVTDTSGFHKYGVLWTEEEIVWYFDDAAIARADTPSDMHDPMYMIVNLAVGGIAGAPNDGLADGSEMKIDYVRAYSLDADWHI